MNIFHPSLAEPSVQINTLHIYKIFFKYFTLIGLWTLLNDKFTVKGTVHRVGIHCAPIWQMTNVRKAHT